MQYLLYHKTHDLDAVCDLYAKEAKFVLERPESPDVTVVGHDNIRDWWTSIWATSSIDFESTIINEIVIRHISKFEYETECIVTQNRGDLTGAAGSFSMRALQKKDTFLLCVEDGACKIAEHTCRVLQERKIGW